MKETLLKHCAKYPRMQIQDAVKLLYQSEFGGGHMISDIGKSLDRIIEESLKNASQFGKKRQKIINYKKEQSEPRSETYERLRDDQMLYEYIGDGICRMYLSVLDEGLRPETLNQMFVWTAEHKRGTVDGFERKLDILLHCCRDGELPWSVSEVQSYLRAYKEQGYPAVSHSDGYRETYHPSYRIVDERFARSYPVFLEIDRVLTQAGDAVAVATGSVETSAGMEKHKPLVIAIDGMCGAGKSTLGNLLSQIYDCNLFHMDDFFLRPEQRTPERYAEVGGNVDYERFKEAVLDHLRDPNGLAYQRFDCSKRVLGEWHQVPYKRLNIVEGSYSQHPYFGDVYDLRFFCGIEPGEQLRRIEQRNGVEMLEIFKSKWIPMENQYLETFGIREKSIVV